MHSSPEIVTLLSQARESQTSWLGVKIRERLQSVSRFRTLLVNQRARLLEALEQDLGKMPGESLGAELLPLAEACRFLERNARTILNPRKIPWRDTPLWMSFQKTWVHRHPRGVVGIIGTWNYPLFLNGVQILQAVVAGNAVLWKPSENACQTAKVLMDLFQQSGFPKGLIQCLEATREAGPQLVKAPLDFLVMTGGSKTGREIATDLGQRLIPSTLELSGVDSLLLCEDGDLDLAANAAWFAATINAGQTCMAARRLFIPFQLVPTFLERLILLAKNSPPRKLRLPSQAEQALAVITNAIEQGAKLEWPIQGVDKIYREGLFSPVILSGVNQSMAFCNEATFAPVMGILPYTSREQAIREINACPYGLCASIFTTNLKNGTDLASKIHCGGVSINDSVAPHAHSATPFGGLGQSGWGVTQGAEGLLEMTIPKVISQVSGRFRPHYDLTIPGKPDPSKFLESLLVALHGESIWSRLASWAQVLKEGRKL